MLNSLIVLTAMLSLAVVALMWGHMRLMKQAKAASEAILALTENVVGQTLLNTQFTDSINNLSDACKVLGSVTTHVKGG